MTDEMRSLLEAEFTAEETRKALKEMGSLKAPGLDGFQPIFYKRTWGITGPTIVAFTHGMLRGEAIPLEATEALLVLIPKNLKPMMIKNFRPISLCNVSIKLVTKMIVNRLKLVLNGIVGRNQTSFIPGHQSIYNVIVCQ